jgi:hypothetical protein
MHFLSKQGGLPELEEVYCLESPGWDRYLTFGKNTYTFRFYDCQ